MNYKFKVNFKRKNNNKSKLIYEEYFINDKYLKKLYLIYLHKTIFDKIIDILVFLAILFTLIGILLEYLINIDLKIIHFIHNFSTIILFIFTIELIREYFLSKSTKHFLKKHWLDVSLILILSFYFLFVTYFGLAKISTLKSANKIAKETKHFRVLFKYFR